MSDINIEDFIHNVRSITDDYEEDGFFEEQADVLSALDESLTLARSYDKLLRELDVANTRQVAPYWPGQPAQIPDWGWAPGIVADKTVPYAIPPISTVDTRGTVWEANPPTGTEY